MLKLKAKKAKKSVILSGLSYPIAYLISAALYRIVYLLGAV